MLCFLVLIYLAFKFSFSAKAHIYPVESTELEDLFDTYPSVVLYFNASDSLSTLAREQFTIASHDLSQYGIILGEFNCTNSPALCQKVNVTSLPCFTFYQFGLISLI